MSSNVTTTLDVVKAFTQSLDLIDQTSVTMFTDFIVTCARAEWGEFDLMQIQSGVYNVHMRTYMAINIALHYIARINGFTTNMKTIHSTYALFSYPYAKSAAFPRFATPLSIAHIYTFLKIKFGRGICKHIFSFINEPAPIDIEKTDYNLISIFSALTKFERFVARIIISNHAYRCDLMIDDFVSQFIATNGTLPTSDEDNIIMSSLTNGNRININMIKHAIPLLSDGQFIIQLLKLFRHFRGWGIVLNKTIHTAK